MELKDCTFGKLVITKDLEIGHIVGVTYNIDISFIGNKTKEEKLFRTIPLVKFADGKKRGIHHSNIELFKG